MRKTVIAVVLALIGCGKSGAPSDPMAAPSPPVAPAASPPAAAGALRMDHVTLLQPEADISARIANPDVLGGLLKGAGAAVIAHGANLPDDLDVIVVARPGGVRVWLTAPTVGDVVAPELAKELAALPAIDVRDHYVAAAIRMTRAATASTSGVKFPGEWQRAAADGKPIDDLLAIVWP
jgi:hypothetical protein